MRAASSASSGLGADREGLVHASAGGAHELAGGGLLVLGEVPDPGVGQAQRGLLAGVGQAGGLELVQRGGGLDGGERGVDGGVDGRLVERVSGTAAPGKVSVIYCS